MFDIAATTTAVSNLIDKALDFIPNKNERARAKEQLMEGMQKAVQDQVMGQIEVNKVEAAHRSIFVAGWRPFIGWICGIGLLWSFLLEPIARWLAAIYYPEVTVLPRLETDGLYQLVLAMLGMGGLRTWEKINRVAKEK